MNIELLQHDLAFDEHVCVLIFVDGHLSDDLHHDVVELQDFLFLGTLFQLVFVVAGLYLVYFQHNFLDFQPV